MKATVSRLAGALSLAVAVSVNLPAAALAASPEFARTQEEWAKLRDNTLEYGEIPALIHEYNPTVQNNLVSFEDYRGKTQNEISQGYRDAAEELYASIDWPSQDDPGYAMLYSAAETAEAQAKQLEKMADENVSDGVIIKLQYDQTEAALASSAQNLMNQYYQLQEKLKTAQAAQELAAVSLTSAQARAAQGMATANDVLSAQENVKKAEAGVMNVQANIQKVRQNLQVMTGWTYDAAAEIGPMPELDISRIDSMNPETDKAKALEHNYTLQIDKRKLENSEDSANKQIQQNTVANDEQKIGAALSNLYSQVLQARDSYNQAKSALELEQQNMEAAQRKYDLGMMSRLEYLQVQNTFVGKKAEYRIQELNLQGAMDAYDWALKGSMTLNG